MNQQPNLVDLGPAAEALAALLPGVDAVGLQAPTPCEQYRVGDLLDHVMGLTVAFREAADQRAEPVGGDTSAAGPPQASREHLHPDWQTLLPERLDALAAAWRDERAWTGTATAGGITMPAEVAAVVALDELVVHGWDLARATGQPFDCDPRSADAVLGLLAASTDDSGRVGLFGPVVPVPEDGPVLDRIVGLTGRNPAWTP